MVGFQGKLSTNLDRMVESATVIRRGRGRPKREDRPAPVTGDKIPKKRGRKPGSLGKKKREAQRLMAEAGSSKLTPQLLADSPAFPDRMPSDQGERENFYKYDYTQVTSQGIPSRNSTSERLHSTLQNRNGVNEFIEPELAVPQPGYSGYPLEALPPQHKLKLPSSGSSRGKRAKIDSSPRSTPTLSEAEAEEAELSYRLQLETPKLETILLASDLRTSIANGDRGKGRRGIGLKDLSSSPSGLKIRIPATPRSKQNLERANTGSSSTSRVKRLKITSPKKHPLVGLAPATEKTPESDDFNTNEDFCASCGGTGVFICCDSCPKSFHLLCCEPPIQEVPDENWNCNECRAEQGLEGRKYYNDLGVFGPLLNAMHGRNPVEFRLPRKLRDATFIDVATGSEGNYTDSNMKPEPSLSKLNGSQIVGFNKNEDLEIDTLYDKNGRPLLCHRCRESGLKRRTLIACDYCPLHWHLDCLDELVSLTKSLGRKWRCPNHIESFTPSFDRRLFRDAAVLDSGLHTNFLRIMEASNYLIKLDDQGYVAEHKQPLLAEYLLFQKEDFISNKSDFVTRHLSKYENSPDSDNDEDTYPNFKMPHFLENYTMENRVVAKSSRRLERILLMTNADDNDPKPFIYRIPEKQIKLDFILKGKRLSKSSVLCLLAQYQLKKEEEEAKEQEAVKNLVFLGSHQNKRNPPNLHLGLNELISVALNSPVLDLELPKVTEDSELDELRRVKKLMEMKGHDEMLKFLKS